MAAKDSKFIRVSATPGNIKADRAVEICYSGMRAIGTGSFGVVYSAVLSNTDEMVAIKKVLQDKRYKNRELPIMRKVQHENIVKLHYFYYSSGEKKHEMYLNLIMECIPENLHRVSRHYAKTRQQIPALYTKLYMYQLFRALLYLHSEGICHRDIKPQNLLINPDTGVLKLCDFGSAKPLIRNEPNVSYICSRYYRAPELIFGANDYTFAIDVWSSGCVMAELILNTPIFAGDSSVDQLVAIIKVLGTPTTDEIFNMNPNYSEFHFPQVQPQPWNRVLRSRCGEAATNFVSAVLQYSPGARLTPGKSLLHPLFDELMEPFCRLPSGRQLPNLFNFTPEELKTEPGLSKRQTKH